MKTRLILFASIISILFSSCSIEKRLYRPGYSIEWNKARTSTTTVQTSKNTEERNSNSFVGLRTASIEIKEPSKKNADPLLEKTDAKGSKIVTANSLSEIRSITDAPSNLSLHNTDLLFEKKKSIGYKTPVRSGDDRELDGMAVWGFILGLGSFLLILFFIVSADTFIPFFFIMLLELISIILSSIAISHIVKDGSKYKGMGLSIFGISFSAVPFVVLLLVYLLFFSALI